MRVLRTAVAGRLVGSVRHLLAALVCATLVAVPTHPAGAEPKPTPAAASTGSIGLRLVDAPAASRDDPRARLYIVDHIRPGRVIHRRIEVTNGTSSTAHVALYAGAASIANGTFLGAAAGALLNDLSSWTSVSPSSVDVPALGRVTLTVTLAVPRDAAPGEQYGVVWAETRSATPAVGGVTQVSRVGIRLYLSVGPGGPPAANFKIESLTAARSAAGQPLILATVRNTGGRALDMSGTLNLRGGPGGLSAGPFAARLGVTLALGAVEPVQIALDRQLPAGPWKAQITLRSGLVERSAEATISFPVAGVAPPVKIQATVPLWRYVAIAGFVVLLLAAMVVFALRRRRRRPVDSVAEPTMPTEPLMAAEPVTVAEPVMVDLQVPARHERRRPVPERASRLADQPMTVDAIADAPFHWELALPNSQDELTSLANRSLFEDETQFAMDAGAELLYLLRIGLDQFDEVNRVHGREVGDKVLVVLTERLRSSVRPKDLTGRLGGVDFAVLFEDVQPADINAIAERVLLAVREPFTVAGHEVFVQASVGVAAAVPTDDATRLLQHATDALAFARITAGAEHQWYVETAAPTAT